MADKQYGLSPVIVKNSDLTKNLFSGTDVYTNIASGGKSYYDTYALPTASTEKTVSNMVNDVTGTTNLTNTDTVFGLGTDTLDNGLGIGDWFSNNKDMLGVGLGLGQLGLGYLNYSANKDALDSDLKTAEQKRELLATAQTNRENIANKAQSALRFT